MSYSALCGLWEGLAALVHREAGLLPGVKSTEEGSHLAITAIVKQFRHTGACKFVWSRAVHDDPPFLIQAVKVIVQFRGMDFYCSRECRLILIDAAAEVDQCDRFPRC